MGQCEEEMVAVASPNPFPYVARPSRLS